MAASAPEGKFVEIGTSAGYSGLYIGLACREVGANLTTIEISAERAKMAADTFRLAEMDDVIDLKTGDAREFLQDMADISFCFLDAEKEVYFDCYDLIVPRMVNGGLLIADNVISHAAVLQPLVDRAREDTRVDAVVVPIGKGELVCRRC
jgi:caffeoyl-CoA O-methyltransferase